MKRIILTLWAWSLCVMYLMAQPITIHPEPLNSFDTSSLLKPCDELMLRNVAKLKLSDAERSIPLPAAVNNAESQWMIPIFWQSGNECGQASSVCYTLSYELLRRRNQDYMWGYDFQYPSRFAWNFCNRGSNVGANFMESWEVIRTAGTPTVNEWGGWYNYGSDTRWISGYDIYHSAMRNRISEMYAIPTNTEEGLLTLKHWLYDHLNGEASGGLANFYCTYRGNDYLDIIPEGSPQAGKHILTGFSSNVNHSKTIVGYDDNVRWDYNGDGLFTNDIDINGDGIVDMRDWEVGAVIFCNTFGPDFGDGGYCYLPYCKLASLPAEDGIWNTCVYVVQVKDEVFPQLTYKATISHTSREKICVQAGIANDISATRPEHTLDFFVFHNQGGDHNMQGDNLSAGNSLEFGLDVSPLLNDIIPGHPCKFFFTVIETDPDNANDGTIVNFSLMDYTSGVEVEQAHPSTNVPILNNDTTILSLVRSINFSKPVIIDSLLPDMEAFTDYTYQLSATQGKPSYRWEVSRDYAVEEFTDDFPLNTGQNVSLTNNSNGYAIIPLDFDFPYYGDTYDKIVVYADGYIAFHHQPANWPFLARPDMQTLAQRMICPFKADLRQCSITKQGGSEKMTLFFTAAVANDNGSAINFVVRLHKNGVIEFFYGDMAYSNTSFWSSLTRGDQQINQHLPISGKPAQQVAHRNFRMTPSQLPHGLTLSEHGVLSGKSTIAFNDATFRVTCYDNNDVKDTRTLHLNCHYDSQLLITSCKVNGSEDPHLYRGDTMNFTITVKNLDTLPYTGCQLRFISEDPTIRWIDSLEYFGYIAPNNEYILHGCATCIIDNDAPAGHFININLMLENDISTHTVLRSYMIHQYNIPVISYSINNDSHLFTPNDTIPVVYTIKNNGSTLENFKVKVRYEDNQLIPILDSLVINELGLNAVLQIPTTVYATNAFVQGTTTDAYLDLYINGRFIKTDVVPILGEGNCLDFEDGILPGFIVNTPTDAPWTIDTNDFNNGSFSLVSGHISHSESCTFTFSTTLSQQQNLSFAFKTSTEEKYDWLYFYIDGEQMDKWAGVNDWSTVTYGLTPGEHTFTWTYSKDYSVNGNLDKVWIDDICLLEQISNSATLNITPNEVDIELGLYNNTSGVVNLQYENPNDIVVLFVNQLQDDNGNQPFWVSCLQENDYINTGAQRVVELQFNSIDCEPTDYEATLIIRHTGGFTEVPIHMHILNDVGIDEHASAGQIRLYPNPVDHICHIVSETQAVRSIMLYDASGRMLQQFSVNDFEKDIDLSAYQAGIYIIKITTEDGNCHTQKIIKR